MLTLTRLWPWEQQKTGLNKCDLSLMILVQGPMTSTAEAWGLKGKKELKVGQAFKSLKEQVFNIINIDCSIKMHVT